MRYPLVDLHGNNGSRDGDAPASMRYTECRLTPLAEATLADLKKDTVDWQLTYTETEYEPVYLPGRFPNVLCNGTMGIAVALATNLAPHNLNEVMDAAIYYIHNPNASVEDLYQFIKAPDFPTGGTIINQNDMLSIYKSGKGKVIVRADYELEKNKIVFTSIPYKISKETLIEDIDKLCEAKEIEGITEIRDESNKLGVRFVIELNRNVNAEKIAKKLYALTDLESSFSVNQTVLVNKTPKLMTLKDLIQEYVKHQEEVFTRRCTFDLNKLQARIHIIEGLIKASIQINDIIAIIKKSDNASAAKDNLMAQFGFTEKQAQAILEMKLSKLAHIEEITLQNELKEKTEAANKLLSILNDETLKETTLCEELEAFKKKFGDSRRTKITQLNVEPEPIEEVVAEDCIIAITSDKKIKRIPTKVFKPQKRNTIGVRNKKSTIIATVKSNTLDTLLLFSNKAKTYRIAANDIPLEETFIEKLITLETNENIIVAVSSNSKNDFIWFITKQGMIKKCSIEEYKGAKNKKGISAIKLRQEDSIADILIGNNNDLVIFTKLGQGLCIKGADIPLSSRIAMGIKGITLNKNDEVVAMVQHNPNQDIVLALRNGYIKRIKFKEFGIQGRGTKGIKSAATNIIDAIAVNEEDNIFITGVLSNLYVAAKDIPVQDRACKGIKGIKEGEIISLI